MTSAAAFALKVNNYLSRTVALQKNLTYSNDFKVFGTQNNDEIHLKELCWKIKASSKWDKLDLTAHVTRWVHYPECGKKQNKSPLRVHYSLYFTQKTPHMRQHITLGSMLSVSACLALILKQTWITRTFCLRAISEQKQLRSN